MIPPINYPALILALTSHACTVDGKKGRPYLGDPVYEAVTEHRQAQTELVRQHQKAAGVDPKKWAFYSACADLPHAMYFECGVVLPWVNRDEMKAINGQGWRVEQNISLLAHAPGCAVLPAHGDTYYPGDVLHIGTPGHDNDHVMVVRNQDADHIEVAEYGQPGGAINIHQLVTMSNGAPAIGTRQLLHVLRFRTVLDVADREGKLLPPTRAALALGGAA